MADKIKRTPYWYDTAAIARLKSRRSKSSSPECSSSSVRSRSDEGDKRTSQKLSRSVSVRSHSTHHRYKNGQRTYRKEQTCSKKITESAMFTEKDAFTPGFFNDSDSEEENVMFHGSRRYLPKIKRYDSNDINSISEDSYDYNSSAICKRKIEVSKSKYDRYDSNYINSVSEESYAYNSSVTSEMRKCVSKSKYGRYDSNDINSISEDSYDYNSSAICKRKIEVSKSKYDRYDSNYINSVSEESYAYNSSVTSEMRKCVSKSKYGSYRSRSDSADRHNNYASSSIHHNSCSSVRRTQDKKLSK